MATKKAESFTEADMLPQLPENALRELSFAELEATSQLHINDVDDFAQFDKEDLIGRAMFITDWSFRDGDFGAEFAFVAVSTELGNGWFTDGSSTGVCEQLRKYQSKMEKDGIWEDFKAGELGAMRVPRGLKVSHYQWKDEEGNEQPGTTYYLDIKDR
jgi:hypothetical protein